MPTQCTAYPPPFGSGLPQVSAEFPTLKGCFIPFYNKTLFDKKKSQLNCSYVKDYPDRILFKPCGRCTRKSEVTKCSRVSAILEKRHFQTLKRLFAWPFRDGPKSKRGIHIFGLPCSSAMAQKGPGGNSPGPSLRNKMTTALPF